MAEFNPYEAPRADITRTPRLDEGLDLWREADLLAARSGAEFPDRCIKCDAPAEGYRFKRTLRWHPSGYYFLLLMNIVIYAIVATIVSKKARVEAGLCPMHRKRRRDAILVGWLLALLGIGAMVIGGVAIDQGLGFLILIGIALILIGLVYGIVRSQVLLPKRIKDEVVWLQKVHPEFLASLPVMRP